MKKIKTKYSANSKAIPIFFILFSVFFILAWFTPNSELHSKEQFIISEKNPLISAPYSVTITKNFTNNQEFNYGEEIYLNISIYCSNTTNAFFIISQNESKLLFGYLNSSIENVSFKLNTYITGIFTFNVTIYSEIYITGLIPEEKIIFQESYHIIIKVPDFPTGPQPFSFPRILTEFALFGALGVGLTSLGLLVFRNIRLKIQFLRFNKVKNLFGTSQVIQDFTKMKSEDAFLTKRQSNTVLKYTIANHDQAKYNIEDIDDMSFWDDVLGGGMKI